MAITPKRDKQFLQLLIERKKIPFTEVLDFFSNSRGHWRQDTVVSALRHLWVVDLFCFKKKDCEIEFWGNEDAFFKTPEDCYIELISFVGKDKLISGDYEGEFARKGGISKAGKHYYWTYIQQREEIRVVGETEKATNLIERIQAFTHYFAFNLVSRKLDKVETLFSKDIRNKYTSKMLEELLTKQETTYGTFDFFDHVEVFGVFNGENSDKSESEVPMRPPKGVSKKDRRGKSSFQLVSVYTPNGITINGYYIDLNIIEEDGLLKICHIRWHTGGF